MNDVLNRYYNIIFLIGIIFYNIVPKKVRPIYLLIISLLMFYLMSNYLIVFLLISIISVYISGIWLEKIDNKREKELKTCNDDNKKYLKEKFKHKKKLVLLLCLFINCLFLILFKYLKFFTINTNFFLELLNINYSFNIIKLVSPIGISFYTLQMLSYLFDVYNGKIKADHNFIRLCLFGSFFPCIMEGPICRYSDTAEKIYKCDKITYNNLCYGLQRILWGLFKKIIIADRLNILVKTIFLNPSEFNGTTIFIGALSYTIMLYMDFSGAMDVVIGIGNIFGFDIPENFKQPFFSKNISEFWTRWHISLGSWFKDYIYYPISLSKKMKKLTSFLRKRLGNHYGPLLSGTIALLVVWLLNGLWHGAGWTYILFGLYHFVFISIGNIIRQPLNKLYVKLNISKSNILKFLQIIKTCFFVIIGELIFRSESVSDALYMIKKIFTSFGFKFNELSNLGLDLPDLFILSLSLLIILIVSILKEKNIDIRKYISSKNIFIRWFIYYALIFSIIIFGAYGPGYQPVDPMYADF